MPVSQTTLTGPIYMPDGATPVGGRVSFELSSWDREVGQALILSGPIYSDIDENGQFSVELFTTTEGVNTVNYKMYVLWEDSELSQSYVNNVYVNSPVPHYTKKYIGSFALAGAGPFQVSDLNIVSELELNSFDVLLECQAYSLAASTAGNEASVHAGAAATSETAAEASAAAAALAQASASNSAALANTAATTAQSSARTLATWANLAAMSGSVIGEGAEVLDSAVGTHTDPITATVVANAGRYTWVTTPSQGWRRIGDTGLSAKADRDTTEAYITTRVNVTGTGGVWTGVGTPTLKAYANGTTIIFRAPVAIAGTGVTINIDGLGPKIIQSYSGNGSGEVQLEANCEYTARMVTTAAFRLSAPTRASAAQTVPGASAGRVFVDPAGVEGILSSARLNVATGGGTDPNAQTPNTSFPMPAYRVGDVIVWTPAAVPTTPAFTLAFNGLAPLGVTDAYGSACGNLLSTSAVYLLHIRSQSSARIISNIRSTDEDVAARVRTLGDMSPRNVSLMMGVHPQNQRLLLIGDSITYGQHNDGLDHSYQDSLDAYFAGMGFTLSCLNKSRSGRRSGEIAFLYGAAQNQTVTFAGGQIPASGGVAVATIMGGAAGSTGFHPLGGFGASSSELVTVTANGQVVQGTLAVSGTAYTFTRTTSGVSINASADASITFDAIEAAISQNRTPVLCVGRNNISSPEAVRADILRILKRFTSGLKRSLALVVPTFPLSNGAVDAVDLTRVARMKADLIAVMGEERVLDWPEYMRAHGLARLGLTPTADDLADLAAGLIPRQLRLAANNGHLNQVGDQLLGQLIAERLDALGYVQTHL